MIHVLLYRRVRPRVYRRIATGFAQRVIRLSLGRSGATRPLTMHDGERVFVGGIVRSEIDATFAIQRESESPEGREPARLLRVFECLASDSGFRRRAPPSEPSAPPPPPTTLFDIRRNRISRDSRFAPLYPYAFTGSLSSVRLGNRSVL